MLRIMQGSCVALKTKKLLTQILTHGLIEIHTVALQGLFRWLSLSKTGIMLRGSDQLI